MGAVPGSALAGHIWFPPDVEASEDFPATTQGGPVTHSPAHGKLPAMKAKAQLRRELRQRRREAVAALPDAVRALVFSRPPAAVADMVPAGACVAIYDAMPLEAPAEAYGRWFFERGHDIALPWFAGRGGEMQFRRWANPHIDALLEPDPFGARQPAADAPLVTPDVLFAPLLGFTASGGRMGQGGGHYDRWLAAHPARLVIGLAWDCQLVDELPLESHDVTMNAVVTPTRLYGPF